MHSATEGEHLFDVYDPDCVGSRNISEKPRIHKYCKVKYFKDEDCIEPRNVQTGGISYLRSGCGHWGGLVSSVSDLYFYYNNFISYSMNTLIVDRPPLKSENVIAFLGIILIFGKRQERDVLKTNA